MASININNETIRCRHVNAEPLLKIINVSVGSYFTRLGRLGPRDGHTRVHIRSCTLIVDYPFAMVAARL